MQKILSVVLLLLATLSQAKPLTFVTYHATSQYYPTMSANAIFNAVPYGGKLILKVEPEVNKIKAKKSLKANNLVAEGDVQFGGTTDTKGTLSMHNVTGRAKGLEAVDAHINNLYLYGVKFPQPTAETMQWKELTLENGYTATFLTAGAKKTFSCRYNGWGYCDAGSTCPQDDADGELKFPDYLISEEDMVDNEIVYFTRGKTGTFYEVGYIQSEEEQEGSGGAKWADGKVYYDTSWYFGADGIGDYGNSDTYDPPCYKSGWLSFGTHRNDPEICQDAFMADGNLWYLEVNFENIINNGDRPAGVTDAHVTRLKNRLSSLPRMVQCNNQEAEECYLFFACGHSESTVWAQKVSCAKSEESGQYYYVEYVCENK